MRRSRPSADLPTPNGTQAISPCSSLTPLPLSSSRPSVSFGGFGLGKPSSIVPWPDCAPCHSLPDGGGGNRPPSGQPNVPANSRQSGLRVPLAASSPRYLALTNIRRRSQSLPAATEGQTPAPLYPKSCPDHRPPLPLSPVPLLHSHPFGGFGVRLHRRRLGDGHRRGASGEPGEHGRAAHIQSGGQ